MAVDLARLNVPVAATVSNEVPVVRVTISGRSSRQRSLADLLRQVGRRPSPAIAGVSLDVCARRNPPAGPTGREDDPPQDPATSLRRPRHRHHHGYDVITAAPSVRQIITPVLANEGACIMTVGARNLELRGAVALRCTTSRDVSTRRSMSSACRKRDAKWWGSFPPG